MARPRKTLTDKLTDRINVATTTEVKRTAEAAAKAHGISLSCLMNQALVQWLHPEGRIKQRRSYRRAEVVDALVRSASALEGLAQLVRTAGPEHGDLDLCVGLLKVERLLASVTQGPGQVKDDQVTEEGVTASGDPE